MGVFLKRIGMAALVTALVSVPALAQQNQQPQQKPAPSKPAPSQPAKPAPAPAPAPQAQGPAAQQVDLVQLNGDWTKYCGEDPSIKKEVCTVVHNFGVQDGNSPVLSFAVMEMKGEDQRLFRFFLPPSFLLRPGLRFAVDDGAGGVGEGAFEVCLPNGCIAEARVTKPIVDQLKKGKFLRISVKNTQNLEVIFSAPLQGFGKIYDGPPIDPKVLEAQQKQLQEEMARRAEEERKREQGAGAAAPK